MASYSIGAIVALPVLLSAANLNIDGISSHQVLSRVHATAVSGRSMINGDLSLTVWSGQKQVLQKVIAKLEPGEWKAAIPALPAGGPYRLQFRVAAESAQFDDVLSGDLWLLAGQSNMVGRARLSESVAPDPNVRVLRASGEWEVASEPLHESRPGPEGPIGAGLGLPFAKDMLRRSGVPVGLIPTAVGGTSLWQWDPTLRDEKSLYGNLLKQVRRAGGRVTGVLWYQGEADARTDHTAEYPERMRRFVAMLRADLGDAQLPFYYVQIGRNASPAKPPRTSLALNAIQDAQLRLEPDLAPGVMTAAVDLEMEDYVHVNADGLRRLGLRLAHLASGGPSGPRPVEYIWQSELRLRIRFSGVNGKLRADGRVVGFTLHDSEGQEAAAYYRAWIPADPGNEVVLELNPRTEIPDPLSLWYGFGANPPCNILDSADLPVPAFGPVQLPKRK